MKGGSWRRVLIAALLVGALAMTFHTPVAAGDPGGDETPVPEATPTEIPGDPPGGLPGGETPPGIEISVDPATVSFGGMKMAVPATYEETITITVLPKGVLTWYLRAEDTTPGNPSKGHLYGFGPPERALTTPLQIWDFTLAPPVYRDLGTGNDIFYAGTSPRKTIVEVPFRQEATRNDLSGYYSLIVTFTATTS